MTPNATAYSAMTDDELNRAVAERLNFPAEGLCTWATDLNAAAALDFGDHTVTITLEDAEARVHVSDPLAFTVADATQPREKLARALMLAWLAYRDAMEAT